MITENPVEISVWPGKEEHLARIIPERANRGKESLQTN
jgi:hypothetical protein